MWNPTLGEPAGGPPDPSSIKVAIGNTITEAMAKLVAVDQNRSDETRILEAFQLNALQTLNEADGAAQVDSLLHAKAFGSLPGGDVTDNLATTDFGQSGASGESPDAGSRCFQSLPACFPGTGGLHGKLGLAGSEVSPVRTPPSRSAEFLSQVQLISGDLSSIVDQHLTPPSPDPQPGKWIEVKRALPRFFYPTDPIVLIAGGKATFKHKPGSLSRDGLLYCRLTGDSVTQLSGAAATGRASVKGADLLERGIENGSVPPECDDLLRELAVLDPGTAMAAARSAAGSKATAPVVQALAVNFAVEQTAWHAIRDPRVDHAPLISLSGITGRLPSPVAISLPAHPWNPLRLDWQIEYLPSAGASKIGSWTKSITM